MTCHDYMTRSLAESGYYDIDPDGFGAGQVPFRVFCSMENGD